MQQTSIDLKKTARESNKLISAVETVAKNLGWNNLLTLSTSLPCQCSAKFQSNSNSRQELACSRNHHRLKSCKIPNGKQKTSVKGAAAPRKAATSSQACNPPSWTRTSQEGCFNQDQQKIRGIGCVHSTSSNSFPPILITTHFPVTSLNGPQRNRTPPKFTRTEKSSDLLPSFCHAVSTPLFRAPAKGDRDPPMTKQVPLNPSHPTWQNVYHEKGANSWKQSGPLFFPLLKLATARR